MLVLSRGRNEKIVINHNIIVTVVDIRGDRVRLGIQAPRDVPVHRAEVEEAIVKEANRGKSEVTESEVRPPAGPSA